MMISTSTSLFRLPLPFAARSLSHIFRSWEKQRKQSRLLPQHHRCRALRWKQIRSLENGHHQGLQKWSQTLDSHRHRSYSPRWSHGWSNRRDQHQYWWPDTRQQSQPKIYEAVTGAKERDPRITPSINTRAGEILVYFAILLFNPW